MRPIKTDFSYQKYIISNRLHDNYANNHRIIEYFGSNSWCGERVFIIGGGESIKDFDFNRLKGYKVITTNLGFLHCNSDINFSMDSRLYDKIIKGDLNEIHQKPVNELWKQYKGIRCFITPQEPKTFGNETCLVKRIREVAVSRDLDSGIHGGKNSALGAMMLAIALGSTDIYLLGFDMKCQTQSHFHKGYGPRDLDAFNIKLSQYKKEIEHIAPLIAHQGIKITNCNPNSELKCFAYTSLYQ